MKNRRAPMIVLWVAVAVAAAILTAEAIPSRVAPAQAAEFGAVRPVAAPLTLRGVPAFAPFAQVAGLNLRLPTRHPEAVLYHEASSYSTLVMAPYGRCKVNANASRFHPQSPAAPGLPYGVMATRGRGTAATSAVDIVEAVGSTLYAPVTGTIVSVTSYWLYGAFPDVRVEIRPDGNPNVGVVMIHLEQDVFVRRGQHVVASVTPIGRPRVLPFISQTATYTGTNHPHVHIEIQPLA